MKINIKTIGFIPLLLIFTQGCEDKKQESNPVPIVTEKKSHMVEDEALLEELREEVIDAIYSINGKKYSIKTLPQSYNKSSGKKRALFLEKYINYHISLDALETEQKKYKNQIRTEIKKELDKKNRLGIEIEELDKELLKLDLTLRTIAKEELAKDKKDLNREIKDFYEAHKKEYTYDDNIELSYIYFKEQNRSKEIFAKLKEKEVDIKRFARFAKEYSANKKLKFSGGYFGFLSKTKKQEKFFNTIWSFKNSGFMDEIVERDGYFFLIYIHQKREAFSHKFEDVKDDIRDNIIGKRAKVNRWINTRYRKLIKTKRIKVLDNFENNMSI